MAFADPQSITINAVAQSFVLVSRSGSATTYQTVQEADGTQYTLEIAHQRTNAGRDRHEVRLTHEEITVHPVSEDNVVESTSVYFVIDAPEAGFTAAMQQQLASGLFSWATSANLLKVVGGES